MRALPHKAAFARLLLVAGAVAVAAPQAHAQSFFEALFGGGIKRQNREAFPPAPQPQPRAAQRAAEPAKISAPSYYTYKPDALRRVDFSPLLAIAQQASLDAVPVASDGFREAVNGLRSFDLPAEADIGKAIVQYYAKNPAFIWIEDGRLDARARDALRVLSEAGGHGLDPRDYAVSLPGGAAGEGGSATDALIRFEMAMSARVLRYVHDARGGRIDPNRISGYHDFAPKPFNAAGVLASLAGSGDIRAYLESRHPQNAQYRQLRVELEALRASEENDIVVDPKLLLKPGESSPELPKLLTLIGRGLDDELGGQFGELLAVHAGSEVYSQEIVPLIKAMQQKKGLKPDGVIGPRTVAELAGVSKADRIGKVVVALEQLRWLPSDLGGTYVFINQPAYTAAYIENDAEKLNMRAVIGKTTNQTSFFMDEIEQVDYNPYWGVPQSIIVNEMLPRLRRDPGYLDRAGYEVTDSKGRRIPSSSIDWGQYGSKVPYNVRQTPSEANALGELKILFPNEHAIYMHDTPEKSLFNRDMRAFSHGCVRLQQPREMAAAVLGTTVDHVARKLAQGHSTEKVKRRIPVYVAYFTAWPNAHGKIEYFADVYDRDSRMGLAMKKTEESRAPTS
ncbi:MAG: murein L,D-transpeptidase [Rhizobiaceae bacterium]